MNRGIPHETMRVAGTFIGNATIGSNNKVSHNTITVGGVQGQASLDELRRVIVAARDDLVGAAGGPDAQAEVRYEIRKIEQELSAEEPQGVVVRGRWDQVVTTLGSLAAVSGSIAQITDLITKVFGGS